MEPVSAQRTLVKSPPELWEKLSDAEELARQLEGFGEIRITRLEAERTVVWEGDRVCGTVELEPSGWGTRVTLSARPEGEVPDPIPPDPPLPPDPPVPPDPAPPVPTPEPAAPPAPPAPPIASLTAPAAKRGLFTRLFRRRGAEVAPVQEPLAEEPLPEEPLAAEEPVLEEDTVSDPSPRRGLSQEPVSAEEVAPNPAAAVLEAVLDDLGAAHHRPFSRG